MVASRAAYSWTILGNVLSLEDRGGRISKTLTNDIENCLVEIDAQLPVGAQLTDYRIIYRDSEGVWDAVIIIELGDLHLDRAWLARRGGSYYSMNLKVKFFPLQQRTYQKAAMAIVGDRNLVA